MQATQQQQPSAAAVDADDVHDNSNNNSTDMHALAAVVQQLYTGPDPASLIYSADMPLVAAATVAAHTASAATTTAAVGVQQQQQHESAPQATLRTAQHVAAVMARLAALAEPAVQACTTPRVTLYALADILRYGLLLALPPDMQGRAAAAAQQQHDSSSASRATATSSALTAAMTPVAALPYSSAVLAAVTTPSPALLLRPPPPSSHDSNDSTALVAAAAAAPMTARAADAAAAHARWFHAQATARRVPAVAMVRGLYTLTYVSTKLRVELVLAQLQQRLRDALATHTAASATTHTPARHLTQQQQHNDGSNKHTTTAADADAQRTEALAALLVTQTLVDDVAALYARLVLAVPLLHSILVDTTTTTTTVDDAAITARGKQQQPPRRTAANDDDDTVAADDTTTTTTTDAAAAANRVALSALTRYYYELTDWLARVEATARAPALSYTRVTRLACDDVRGRVTLQLRRPSPDTPWGVLLNERGCLVDVDVAMRVHARARALHALLRSTGASGAAIVAINDKPLPASLRGGSSSKQTHRADDKASGQGAATSVPSVAHALAAAAAGRRTLTLTLRADAFRAAVQRQPVEVAFFVLPAQGGEGCCVDADSSAGGSRTGKHDNYNSSRHRCSSGGVSSVAGQRAALLLQRRSSDVPWPFVVDARRMWHAAQLRVHSALSQRACAFVQQHAQRLRLLAVNGVEVRSDAHARALLARAETALLELVVVAPPRPLSASSSSTPPQPQPQTPPRRSQSPGMTTTSSRPRDSSSSSGSSHTARTVCSADVGAAATARVVVVATAPATTPAVTVRSPAADAAAAVMAAQQQQQQPSAHALRQETQPQQLYEQEKQQPQPQPSRHVERRRARTAVADAAATRDAVDRAAVATAATTLPPQTSSSSSVAATTTTTAAVAKRAAAMHDSSSSKRRTRAAGNAHDDRAAVTAAGTAATRTTISTTTTTAAAAADDAAQDDDHSRRNNAHTTTADDSAAAATATPTATRRGARRRLVSDEAAAAATTATTKATTKAAAAKAAKHDGSDVPSTLTLRNDVVMRALDAQTIVLERASTSQPWGISVEQFAREQNSNNNSSDDATAASSSSSQQQPQEQEQLPLRLLSLPPPTVHVPHDRRRKLPPVTTPQALVQQLTYKPSSWWIAEVDGRKTASASDTLKYMAKQTKLTLRFVRRK